jgi:hypothetical protein
MVAKVKGTVSMVSGWKGQVKEEKMTGRKFRVSVLDTNIQREEKKQRPEKMMVARALKRSAGIVVMVVVCFEQDTIARACMKRRVLV